MGMCPKVAKKKSLREKFYKLVQIYLFVQFEKDLSDLAYAELKVNF